MERQQAKSPKVDVGKTKNVNTTNTAQYEPASETSSATLIMCVSIRGAVNFDCLGVKRPISVFYATAPGKLGCNKRFGSEYSGNCRE
jgi:hypothetical protein